MLLTAGAIGQTDTTAAPAPSDSSSTSDRLHAGVLAVFTGVQRGLHIEQEVKAHEADWLVGFSPNMPLGGAWELSPEFSLWRLPSSEEADVVHSLDPGEGPTYENHWFVKLDLPVRWFPVTSGRFSAYALAGPGCLFWEGAWLTADVGAGACWQLTPLITLTGEARTYLYYHTSERHSPLVLASPVSLVFGVRLRRSQ